MPKKDLFNFFYNYISTINENTNWLEVNKEHFLFTSSSICTNKMYNILSDNNINWEEQYD